MGWEVVRIRESEFEFDQDHELSVVWQRLEDRDIHPVDVRNDVASSVATEDPPPRDEGLDL